MEKTGDLSKNLSNYYNEDSDVDDHFLNRNIFGQFDYSTITIMNYIIRLLPLDEKSDKFDIEGLCYEDSDASHVSA